MSISPLYFLRICLSGTLAFFLLTSCTTTPKDVFNGRPIPPKRLEFTYAQLQLRDHDEIRKLLARRMSEGNHLLNPDTSITAEASEKYEGAIRILLSRPDQDGARLMLFTDIRKQIAELQILDQLLQDLTDESIGALRGTEANDLEKATYVHILSNLMGEIKPEFRTNENLKNILIEIRDADLVLSPEVRKANLLRSMDPLANPSETAKKILKNAKLDK